MARSRWKQWQPNWDHRRLVFIDETGLNTQMTRLYRRAPRSERCLDRRPHGYWHTNTFIAALRHDRLDAPWLLDGPMNGQAFLVYVSQILAPTLRTGDLVICDNLSSHKVSGVAQALEQVGASLLYLPPYSPDLNPIEMAFSKLKALIRKQCARSFDELFAAVADATGSFQRRTAPDSFVTPCMRQTKTKVL
nr:IS630 family transposase [Puniceicoccus vermicola]